MHSFRLLSQARESRGVEKLGIVCLDNGEILGNPCSDMWTDVTCERVNLSSAFAQRVVHWG